MSRSIKSISNTELQMTDYAKSGQVKLTARISAKHTGRTLEGHFRKTKIVRDRELFFLKAYRSKTGQIIGCFVSNTTAIQDTYGAKSRVFSHVEIPMREWGRHFDKGEHLQGCLAGDATLSLGTIFHVVKDWDEKVTIKAPTEENPKVEVKEIVETTSPETKQDVRYGMFS